jgi:hypothetical protein
MFERIMTESDL